MDVRLEYGKTNITVNVPGEKIAGIYLPKLTLAVKSLRQEILTSLEKPLGTKELKRIISPGNSIVILVDDITRAIPTDKILSIFIPYLRRYGARVEDMLVICAAGAHRGIQRG